MNLRTSRWNGHCPDQRSSAVECCGQKRLRVVGDREKRTPWGTRMLKKLFEQIKAAFKALLQNMSSSDLQSRYTEARKAAALAV